AFSCPKGDLCGKSLRAVEHLPASTDRHLLGLLDGVVDPEVEMLSVDLEADVPAIPVGVNVAHSRLRVGLRALAVAGVLRLGHQAQVCETDARPVEAHVVNLHALGDGAVSPL